MSPRMLPKLDLSRQLFFDDVSDCVAIRGAGRSLPRATMMYLGYNATTPLCDEAREAMLPYLDSHFGNPSSVHAAGRETRAAIDNARDKLAVLGLARCPMSSGGHVISNKAEHHAVLNALEHLEKRENFEVTWLDVSRD